MRPSKNKFGFTLIEILMSVMIISFLGGVIYSTLSQGIKIWHRIIKKNVSFDIDLLWEKVNQDIRSALYYSEEGFNGNQKSISFYTLADPRHKGSEGMISLVKYQYDVDKKNIRREKTEYTDLLNKKNVPTSDQVILDQISDCDFEFYYDDESGGAGGWKNTWIQKCFPKLVKIKVSFLDEKKNKQISKTIKIPLGGNCSVN